MTAIFFSNSKRIGSFGKKGSEISLSEQKAELLKIDEFLHARLWQLQDMDRQYASLATTEKDVRALAKSNAGIEVAEKAYAKAIDSVEEIGRDYDEKAGTNDFQNMIAFFRTILENRRFLSYVRATQSAEGGGSEGYKQTILALREELNKKERTLTGAPDNNESKKALHELQTAVADRDKQILNLQTQIQKDEAEKQTYVQGMQRLQTEVAEKNKIITSLGNKGPDQKTLASLQTGIAEKNKQISDLQAQLQKEQSDRKTSVQKLQTDLAEKDKMIATLNKKTPTDQKVVVNLQNELTQKNKQITDLQTQVQKEQSEKKIYTQSNEKYKNDLVEKDKMISALSNIKVPIDQKGLTNLQSELAQKNNQVTDLQTQLQKAQADKQTYAQSIQKLQTDLSEKNKQITVLGGKNTTADQKALLSLQATVNEKNKKIAELENQATADKEIYTETISNLQNELIEKNKTIASAGGRKVPTDEKAVVTLQNEIAEKDKRIRRLEDQLKSNTPASGETIKDLQQKNSSLRLAYNNSMTQLGTLQKKYNSLKSEMEGLRSQR